MRSYEVVRVYPTPKGIFTCIYYRFEKQEGAKRETLLFRPPLRKGDSAHGKAHSCKQTMSLLIRISDSLRFPEMEIKEVFEALLISLLMSVNPFSSIHFCKYFFHKRSYSATWNLSASHVLYNVQPVNLHIPVHPKSEKRGAKTWTSQHAIPKTSKMIRELHLT